MGKEPYDKVVAAEAVNEIASALLRAASLTLESHGDRDPNTVPILAAGFVRAIQLLDKIDPVIGKIIRIQLSDSEANHSQDIPRKPGS